MKIFALLFLGFVQMVQAKQFSNSYISFEISDSWKCTLEHTEYLCRSEKPNEAREAVIVLTAKEAGPTDSFDSYVTHLRAPLKNTLLQRSERSTITIAPRQVGINGHPWIDSLHMGSEVNNYYTRYLVTIKDQLAVLVTLSAHRSVYAKYSTGFNRTVGSLRVIGGKNLLSSSGGGGGGLGSGGGILGVGSRGLPADLLTDPKEGPWKKSSPKGGSGKMRTLFMGLGLILVAMAAYILLKRR